MSIRQILIFILHVPLVLTAQIKIKNKLIGTWEQTQRTFISDTSQKIEQTETKLYVEIFKNGSFLKKIEGEENTTPGSWQIETVKNEKGVNETYFKFGTNLALLIGRIETNKIIKLDSKELILEEQIVVDSKTVYFRYHYRRLK